MSGAKETFLSFRCDEEYAESVLLAAAQRDMSKSEFIRFALDLAMCFPTDREIIRQRAEFYRKTSVILEKV